MAHRSPSRPWRVLAVSLLVACGEGGGPVSPPPPPPPPEPPRATSIAVEPASATLVSLGETVTFRAPIRDQYGADFPGAASWTSSDPAVFTVNESGVATAVANGSGAVTATFSGLSATATVEVAQAATALAAVSGDGQRAKAGTALPEPVVVRVEDAGGSPVRGATVAFRPGDGHGTADPAEAVTDTAGLAETTWTLGDVGEQTLTATVADGPSVQVTAALLTPDDFVRTLEVVSGSGQRASAGGVLPGPVVVRAVDEAGAPVAGATVSFRPGEDHGSAEPGEALTDTAGRAETTWTLGPAVGTQALAAWVRHVFATVTATAVNPDRAALEAFYRATGGPDWDNNENWLTDAPLGTWHGVDTDGDGRVVTLEMYRNNLAGSIPAQIGELTRLEQLGLKDNGLTSVPSEIGRLARLEGLDLTGNLLTAVPPELFDLPELDWLGLGRNRLTRIPPEVGNAPRLRNVSLRLNELTGDIPPELGSMPALGWLDLSANRLTGEIPPELGSASTLLSLRLDGNELTGSIPPAFGNLASLRYLRLNHNQLAGDLPPELGRLLRLEDLLVNDNRLVGAIPSELGGLAALRELDLARNDLEGAIPPELGTLRNLRHLRLSDNAALEGMLPVSLSNLENLEQFLADGTGLCAPDESRFIAWLASVPSSRVRQCVASRAYLTQAVQSREHPVPLVAGETALLRVFVTSARETDEVIPPVRATFFVDGTEVHVADISAGSSAIPTRVQEGELDSSANAEIPAAVMQPGLEMVVEIDPDGTLDASLGVSGRIPAEGRKALDVRIMPTLNLTLIPFVWTQDNDRRAVSLVDELQPDHELLWATNRLLPVGAVEITKHDPVMTDSNNAFTLVREVERIRTVEGATGHWQGLLYNPAGNIAGVARTPGKVSFVHPEASVIAHELGHNFSLSHAPCGVTDADPRYPWTNGGIGVWGYDSRDGGSLVPPDAPDLMSYCHPRWVSDYHFTNSLKFRLADEGAPTAARNAAKSLLVSGEIGGDGSLRLDPAFVVDAPPVVPNAAGPYALTGRRPDGSELFSVTFDTGEVAHGDGRSWFVFSLPAEPGWASELASLSLSGPDGEVEIREGSEPAQAIVRDPRTGQVRGILRGLAEDPLADSDLDALAAEPGVEVLISRGVPGPAAWGSPNRF
ncbi:leucine-rich repeat domain-containing protein [Candidatus Palauibacter sp.]|uniref:leucine-rich repeat domain-containing protein n=1 Tax=Candidatus Palauibacter sp. TaxID=3101350 RepID=UPI003B5BBBC4